MFHTSVRCGPPPYLWEPMTGWVHCFSGTEKWRDVLWENSWVFRPEQYKKMSTADAKPLHQENYWNNQNLLSVLYRFFKICYKTLERQVCSEYFLKNPSTTGLKNGLIWRQSSWTHGLFTKMYTFSVQWCLQRSDYVSDKRPLDESYLLGFPPGHH